MLGLLLYPRRQDLAEGLGKSWETANNRTAHFPNSSWTLSARLLSFEGTSTETSVAERVIPKEFGVSVSTTGKTTFDRTQIPLTSAFSMSDFRVQGKGLRDGIFDLKKPPSGRLLLANIYVMLSRVSNWEDLTILRPFEDGVLQSKADDELTAYDEILKFWDMETERRVVNNGRY